MQHWCNLCAARAPHGIAPDHIQFRTRFQHRLFYRKNRPPRCCRSLLCYVKGVLHGNMLTKSFVTHWHAWLWHLLLLLIVWNLWLPIASSSGEWHQLVIQRYAPPYTQSWLSDVHALNVLLYTGVLSFVQVRHSVNTYPGFASLLHCSISSGSDPSRNDWLTAWCRCYLLPAPRFGTCGWHLFCFTLPAMALGSPPPFMCSKLPTYNYPASCESKNHVYNVQPFCLHLSRFAVLCTLLSGGNPPLVELKESTVLTILSSLSPQRWAQA